MLSPVVAMPHNPLAYSTFLDAFGANLSTTQQYDLLAAGIHQPLLELLQYGSVVPTIRPASGSITVGLVLDRANDPTALLSGNWAQRQAALAAFAEPSTPWATYGADPALYDATRHQIIQVVGQAALDNPESRGHLSSAADRTIWVTLDPTQFEHLFGRPLLDVGGTLAWTGSLGIDDRIAPGVIKGLWFTEAPAITNPHVLFPTPVALSPGPLGIGNATVDEVIAMPAALAAHYNFPLGPDVATAPVALVEVGEFGQGTLFADYNLYRQQLGLPPGSFTIIAGASTHVDSGTILNPTTSGELAGDISIVSGGAPNSSLLLYADLSSSPYVAYQRAFFDTINRPAVLSASWGITGQTTALSPFKWAFEQLMVDSVLANISVHRAAGDYGSNGAIANGSSNYPSDHSSVHSLLVGGTSVVTLSSALGDPTMQALLALALNDDPDVVFSLVAAGLKTLPSSLSSAAPSPLGAADTLTMLFETVWQSLDVTVGERSDGHHNVPVLEVGFGGRDVASGGISSTTDVPGYQRDYGLQPLTGGGRGLPDVAALAGGDMRYTVLNANYVNGDRKDSVLSGGSGTSFASPLWAALTTQFNAIFQDQGLPDLGFYNDLLYIASVIAPGSFNDIELGNNVTGFYTTAGALGSTGYYDPVLDLPIVPTGHGYSALPGYDLVSGLGTPNGTLLARALTAIAHSQVSFSITPALLDDDGQGGWQSGADQSLLFQTTAVGGGASVHVDVGSTATDFFSANSGSFAWTSRLAQQSLQADFDPGLVLMFDRQSQGSLASGRADIDESVRVHIDGATAWASQAKLSNPFGFADFFGSGDAVRVARPVAVAETAGGQDDQLAVVRLRQGGENSLQLTFYKVDDLAGTIDGLAPGHPAYVAAMQAHAYQISSGASVITGPGYGQFSQTLLQGIDAGDIVAMRLDNLTTGAFYWAFANANEQVAGQSVGHIWNYGLNTWGWEDTFGGGDRDFNDLVVQIDFTSATGNGWLA
jgi:hypothetical protein